ncbi:MAG TPA: DNA repair exonuclease [Syntrophorhabdaceae bacterium]|jgi:DNA repair exonuclease SbcCD nuclease subunit
MKFIHAADIHLDSPMIGLERYDGAPVEEVRAATRRALQNLVELAINEDVDFVMIAGDLYDGDWKDYNTGLFFLTRMIELREAGVRVVIVAGNHDAASQITKNLRIPDNVKMLSVHKAESVILESAGVAIHGQGFSTRAVTDNLAAHYPKPLSGLLNIGLLHTCLDGRKGYEPYAPCSLDELLSRGYEYWALGHVHNREIIHREPWVVFPGNCQGRNVRETGAKGCTLVSAEDGTVTNVEFKRLDVFRWSIADVNITGVTDTDEIIDLADEALKEELRTNESEPTALRIRLHGSSKVHGKLLTDSERLKSEIRAVATDVGNGSIWVEKICINTTGASDPDELTRRDDALGGLSRSIHNLQYDETALEDMFQGFGDLFRKLPHEYLNDGDAVHPENKESLSRVAEEVKHMLLSRILSFGGDR